MSIYLQYTCTHVHVHVYINKAQENTPTTLLHVNRSDWITLGVDSHPGTVQNKDYTCECTFDVQSPMLLAAFMARYTSCYVTTCLYRSQIQYT